MRKAFVGFIGIVLMAAMAVENQASEAANSCSLSGSYTIDGLGEAAGFLEVVGTLVFTPNQDCTSGTVGGSITIRRQGDSPSSFAPSGTYSVSSDGSVTLSLPGVIDMVGSISQDPGAGLPAGALHLGAAFAAPQVFSVTGTRMPTVSGFGCAPDSRRSGPACVDIYEGSVWQTDNAGVIAKINSGTVTLADLTAAGATQIGAASNATCTGSDYPATFPATGNWTAPLYAVSIPGVLPSACITWLQAEQACALSGKRLLTNQEWQRAAAGTPDPGAADDGSTSCVTSSAGPANTGARATCVSSWGVKDMAGNVWEWVDNWGNLAPSCTNWPGPFGGDLSCFGGGAAASLPGAIVRGGGWANGTGGGVFAVNRLSIPSQAFKDVGFRCAR